MAFGFTPWKQRNLRRFLAGSQLQFRAPWQRIPRGVDAVVVWGRRADRGCLRPLRVELPVLQVEDGFLRSVGLGADLVDPVSWVVDHRGVYDAIQPSVWKYAGDEPVDTVNSESCGVASALGEGGDHQIQPPG